MMTTALCPVCWRSVEPMPTTPRQIAGHRDKAGNLCPASWEPFAITIGYAA